MSDKEHARDALTDAVDAALEAGMSKEEILEEVQQTLEDADA